MSIFLFFLNHVLFALFLVKRIFFCNNKRMFLKADMLATYNRYLHGVFDVDWIIKTYQQKENQNIPPIG